MWGQLSSPELAVLPTSFEVNLLREAGQCARWISLDFLLLKCTTFLKAPERN